MTDRDESGILKSSQELKQLFFFSSFHPGDLHIQVYVSTSPSVSLRGGGSRAARGALEVKAALIRDFSE